MPARTGAEFLDRLSSTRTHVEIQGETLNGGLPTIRRSRTWCAPTRPCSTSSTTPNTEIS